MDSTLIDQAYHYGTDQLTQYMTQLTTLKSSLQADSVSSEFAVKVFNALYPDEVSLQLQVDPNKEAVLYDIDRRLEVSAQSLNSGFLGFLRRYGQSLAGTFKTNSGIIRNLRDLRDKVASQLDADINDTKMAMNGLGELQFNGKLDLNSMNEGLLAMERLVTGFFEDFVPASNIINIIALEVMQNTPANNMMRGYREAVKNAYAKHAKAVDKMMESYRDMQLHVVSGDRQLRAVEAEDENGNTYIYTTFVRVRNATRDTSIQTPTPQQVLTLIDTTLRIAVFYESRVAVIRKIIEETEAIVEKMEDDWFNKDGRFKRYFILLNQRTEAYGNINLRTDMVRWVTATTISVGKFVERLANNTLRNYTPKPISLQYLEASHLFDEDSELDVSAQSLFSDIGDWFGRKMESSADKGRTFKERVAELKALGADINKLTTNQKPSRETISFESVNQIQFNGSIAPKELIAGAEATTALVKTALVDYLNTMSVTYEIVDQCLDQIKGLEGAAAEEKYIEAITAWVKKNKAKFDARAKVERDLFYKTVAGDFYLEDNRHRPGPSIKYGRSKAPISEVQVPTPTPAELKAYYKALMAGAQQKPTLEEAVDGMFDPITETARRMKDSPIAISRPGKASQEEMARQVYFALELITKIVFTQYDSTQIGLRYVRNALKAYQ